MSDKTEEPSARKLEDAHARGQVVHSFELNAAIGLIAGAFLLQSAGKLLTSSFSTMLHDSITSLSRIDITYAWIQGLFLKDISLIIMPLGTLVLGIMLTGIITTIVQTGLHFPSKRKFFDPNRFNPITGLKRLFSMSGLQQLVKSILKLLVIGLIVYSFLKGNIPSILKLAGTDLQSAIGNWVNLAIALIWKVAGAYIVIAAADYAYLRWEFMKNMRMTKQEVKDEVRQTEGDPFLRARIRQVQRQMMARRMMAAVPRADVIVTNPTHFAVAIKYDPEKMKAPKVLAKGSLLVAQKIVEIARNHQVPVVQNVPLARALFHLVEIDQEIPAELYMATAEILAYIYRLKGKYSQTERATG
jgi:flagellar biosynthesis protein FlhB